MHASKCYDLQHFEACMCQNAIIYITLKHACAKMLLFTALRSLMMPISYDLLGIPFVFCQCRASMSWKATGDPTGPRGAQWSEEGPRVANGGSKGAQILARH